MCVAINVTLKKFKQNDMSGVGQVDVQVTFLKRLNNHGKIKILEQCLVYQKFPQLLQTPLNLILSVIAMYSKIDSIISSGRFIKRSISAKRNRQDDKGQQCAWRVVNHTLPGCQFSGFSQVLMMCRPEASSSLAHSLSLCRTKNSCDAINPRTWEKNLPGRSIDHKSSSAFPYSFDIQGHLIKSNDVKPGPMSNCVAQATPCQTSLSSNYLRIN